ncbi:Hypothetical predicted protein [Octopus vulgaris]|uniref:Craniofacial development protein 2-like n=1 Tax=Octopus vulgaris TaxID=6645 RepID=A0AA36BYT4_OCTVU|nr:Hypothetical predicted protein [Octopus vulgaris]
MTGLLFVVGDFNGHVGQHPGSFNGVRGGYGLGSSNEEGTRLLELCDADILMICYTNLRKPTSLVGTLVRLTTFSPGNRNVGYLLMPKLSQVTNAPHNIELITKKNIE